MLSHDAVRIADRVARRRPVGMAVAVLAFLLVQIVARPALTEHPATALEPRSYMWATTVVVLLLLLRPITGAIWGRRVRELVNDEVSQANATVASALGLRLAVGLALAAYFLPVGRALGGTDVGYLIATLPTAITVLHFAWLEARAHRSSDGADVDG